jgi:hypothetical protein
MVHPHCSSGVGNLHTHLPIGVTRCHAACLGLASIRANWAHDLSGGLVLLGGLWNHSPFANVVSDRVPAMLHQPSLSHGAFDNMPLNSFALRAAKSSQILTRTARLNRRQLHRRAASGALRPLVLRVEHRRSSIRHTKFAGNPAGHPGIGALKRVRRNHAYLNMIAFGAFE